MRSIIFIMAFLVPSPLVAMSWDFAPRNTLTGVTPSAATGAGLSLSPAPVVFESSLREASRQDAPLGTEALIALGPCADGSCGVAGQPVRNVARAVAARPRLRRLFGGRPVRSFLGRVFGGCR